MVRKILALSLVIFGDIRPVPGQEPPSHSSWESAATTFGDASVPENAWAYSLLGSFYFVPQDVDYFSPVLTIDHNALHFEARYNYEGIDAASLWLGYNFSFGEKLKLDFAPMVGGVFGNLRGLAPGWRLAFSAGKFDLSSESEFVFNTRDSSENFFYTWSELRWHPLDWMSLGVAAQRSRTFETHLDVQRGLLAGVVYKDVDLTFYVFNLGWEDPTFVFSIGITF